MNIVLNDDELICKKCKGTGKYLSSASAENPQHNHTPHHNHSYSSYAVETACSKCNGRGKVDWITNAMGEGKNLSNIHTHSLPSHTHGNMAICTTPASGINFYAGGKEVLTISDDGFYVNGNKLPDDKDVYERFHKFLKDSGY